jgi:hypothetical protein
LAGYFELFGYFAPLTRSGSGTTIIAAERTGRRARTIELDSQYVDVAVRRWQAATGKHALHADTGKAFEDIEEERRGANDNALIALGEVA